MIKNTGKNAHNRCYGTKARPGTGESFILTVNSAAGSAYKRRRISGAAPGRELSPWELNDIAAADAYPAALNAALDYASRTNAKSRSEFLARLSDFPKKAAQAAVKRMEELGYIDDAALAAQIVKRGLANGERAFMLKKAAVRKADIGGADTGGAL